MAPVTSLDAATLDAQGLNLHAVFDLDRLPSEIAADLRERFDPAHRFRQLLLIGHGGSRLWAAVKASAIDSAHPIDDFSRAAVSGWFRQQFPQNYGEIIYPGSNAVRLQTLGKLAGWHHTSPMAIGINDRWGTWFAYRVALLADTALAPTRPMAGTSPCDRCADKPCIANCPAGALARGVFALEKCTGYRKRSFSDCKNTCRARLTCPAGAEHRYPEEQLRHSYSISLRKIEQFY